MASSRVFPKDAKLKAASPVSNSGKSGGLNCPVCDKPLGEPNYCYSLGVNGYYSLMNQNYKMLVKEKDTEARRKRIEEEWEGRKQRKQDTEVVVAATCGELFHKACLRRFCSSTFRANQVKPITGKLSSKDRSTQNKTQCPRCLRQIMFSLHREVDIDSHKIKGISQFDRDTIQAEIMSKELQEQLVKEKQTLQKLETALENASMQLEKAKKVQNETNFLMPPNETASSLKEKSKAAKKRRKEQRTMEAYIEKAQKVIEYMQQETPTMMRMYLKQVNTRSYNEIVEMTPIPPIVIPYLEKIPNDEYCLFALSQIIKPGPYPGANFDSNSLIAGILNKVNPPLKEKLAYQAQLSGHNDLEEAYYEFHPDLRPLKKHSTASTIVNIVQPLEVFNCDSPSPETVDLKKSNNISHNLGQHDLRTTYVNEDDFINANTDRDPNGSNDKLNPTLFSETGGENETATDVVHIKLPIACSSESAFERSLTELRGKEPSVPAISEESKSKESGRSEPEESTPSNAQSESSYGFKSVSIQSSVSAFVSDFELERDVDVTDRSRTCESLLAVVGSTSQCNKEHTQSDTEAEVGQWNNEQNEDLEETGDDKVKQQHLNKNPIKPNPVEATETLKLDNNDVIPVEADSSHPEESSSSLHKIVARLESRSSSLSNSNLKDVSVKAEASSVQSVNAVIETPVVSIGAKPNLQLPPTKEDTQLVQVPQKPSNNDTLSGSVPEPYTPKESDLELTPSGNVLCTIFRDARPSSNQDSPLGFLDFLSLQESKTLGGIHCDSNKSFFVTCLTPDMSKIPQPCEPFPSAPKVVAFGRSLQSNREDENGSQPVKIPIPYMGHYPPKHEVHRAWGPPTVSAPLSFNMSNQQKQKLLPPYHGGPRNPPIRMPHCPRMVASAEGQEQIKNAPHHQDQYRVRFPHIIAFESAVQKNAPGDNVNNNTGNQIPPSVYQVGYVMQDDNLCYKLADQSYQPPTSAKRQYDPIPSSHSAILSSIEMGKVRNYREGHISNQNDETTKFEIECEKDRRARIQHKKTAKLCLEVRPSTSQMIFDRNLNHLSSALRASIISRGTTVLSSRGEETDSDVDEDKKCAVNPQIESLSPNKAAAMLKQKKVKRESLLRRSTQSLHRLLTPRGRQNNRVEEETISHAKPLLSLRQTSLPRMGSFIVGQGPNFNLKEGKKNKKRWRNKLVLGRKKNLLNVSKMNKMMNKDDNYYDDYDDEGSKDKDATGNK